MSGLYPYGLVRPAVEPGSDLAGVGAGPVRQGSFAGLDLWVEEMPHAPPVTLAAVRGHEAVVRAAWLAAGACLPFRFGQWMPSATALEAHLEARRQALEEALGEVHGSGEFALRILEPLAAEPTSEGPVPRTGRGHLLWLQARAAHRRERERRGRELAEELAAQLEGVIRRQRLDPGSGAGELVQLSHLVPLGLGDEYGSRVRRFGAQRPALELRGSGPWPPFSFAP